MNQKQFEEAVEAGLHLTNSDAQVPTRLATGVVLLNQLLTQFATGQLAVVTPQTLEKREGEPEESE